MELKEVEVPESFGGMAVLPHVPSPSGKTKASAESLQPEKLPGVSPSYSVLFARLAIISLFAVSVSLLTIFSWYWTSQTTRNATNSLGSSLRHDILNRSAGHMLRVLSDQAAALRVTEEAAYYQHRLTGSVLGPEMRRQIWGVVSNPNYDLICATHAESAPYQYMRPNSTGGKRWYKEIYSDDDVILGEPQVSYTVKLDFNGNRIGNATVRGTSLDYRTRDYYQGAQNLSREERHWSMLYSDQGFPVMVVSGPLRDNLTGAFLGVNTVGQDLSDLSSYMVISDLKGGILYFKTTDDILLASAGPVNDFLDKRALRRLRRANESYSPILREADGYIANRWGMPRLLAGPTAASDVKLGGDKYYVDTLPIHINNLQVVAVIAIPRHSITGAIDARAHSTIIYLVSLSTAIFVLGCVLVVFFTMRVSSEVKLKAALDAAKRRAEAHSQAKSMFLSNVSHELRTPMAGIMGLLDLLLAEELQPEQAVNVSQIRQCATNLLGLLNNLLDLGKIEAGRLELESADFDVVSELESIVDMFAVQCRNKGVEIGLEVPGDLDRLVRGDSARVRQVVVNLLSNAVKFSSAGGFIAVRAWPLPPAEFDPSSTQEATPGPLDSPQESTGWFSPCQKSPKAPTPVPEKRTLGVVFEVEDTGIGIPQEKRDKVFENFVQADPSTTRLHGGTGLGLGIVKSLVQMMGGDIRIVDKSGPGTLVRFEVLFDEPQSEAPAAVTAAAPEVRGGHVVLGMPGNLGRGIAERYLKAQGMAVHFIHDVEEAILCARALGSEIDGVNGLASESDGVTFLASEIDGVRALASDSDGVDGFARLRGGDASTVPFLMRQPSDHRVLDMEQLMEPTNFKAGPSPVFVILDAAILEQETSGDIRGQLRQLHDLQDRAAVAWLVSTTTPVPTRQVLKASFQVAHKPLYNTRLQELLVTMTSGSRKPPPTDFPVRHPVTDRLRLNESEVRSSNPGDVDSIATVPLDLASEKPSLETQLAESSVDRLEREANAAKSRPATSGRSAPELPLPLTGMRVLVAEDSPILQRLTLKILTKLGATVHCVEDGQQAATAVVDSIRGLQGPSFDAVLMDCQMPNVDGYQSTKMIRQAEANTRHYTPIAALTAHAMASDRDKCLAVGMDGYLSKPLSQAELVSTLTSIVGRKRTSV